MLRWILLVMAIGFAQHSLAQAEQDYTMDMSAATDISQIIDKKYGDRCDNFAGDGEVKNWGKIVEAELDKGRHAALYAGPSDVRRICKKYDEMNDEDKKGLWILIISAMTHYESTCTNSGHNKGPNGTAAGLLQLHRGKEANYSAGCRNGDSDTPGRSIVCAMSMLNDQIERGEPLFSRNSYWDVLRPQGESQKWSRIQAAIQLYPACKTGRSSEGNVPLDVQPEPQGSKKRVNTKAAKKISDARGTLKSKPGKKSRTASK